MEWDRRENKKGLIMNAGNSMELIRATEQDADELLAFYRHVADKMEEQGIDHWHWGQYPNEEFIREDIAEGSLYYMLDGNLIAAAVSLMVGQEKEYDDKQWSFGVRPGSFRRLAVHPSMQGGGVGGLVLDDVLQILRRSGCDCVRCDTAEKNRHAIRLYEKLGFRPCGTMYWPEVSGRNICFDKPLKRETPMWPIPMSSDFRDAMGRSVLDLVKEYGEKLVGNFVEEPLPLQLRLIDAEQRKNMQLNPNGARAKVEAWLVPDSPPGGGLLICGFRPGTSWDFPAEMVDPDCEPVPLRVEKSFGVKRVLSEKVFTLDLIRTDAIEMLPAVHEFGVIIVTEGETELRFAGGAVRMKAGETCLLPRNCPPMAFVGPGAAALAMPS